MCLFSIKIIFVCDWIYVMIYKVAYIEHFIIPYLKMHVYSLAEGNHFHI